MKKLLLLALLAAIMAGGYFFMREEPAKEENSPTGTTAEVERGSIVERVDSDGKVVSNLDVEIKCKASGEVVSLPYDVSQKVKKGALIAELDPVDEKRSVRQAKAALESARAKLTSAKEELLLEEANLSSERGRANSAIIAASAKEEDSRAKAKRIEELLASKLASREEYDTARTTAVTAEADLKEARLSLDEIEAKERALEVTRQSIRIAETEVEIKKIALEVAEQRLADTKVVSPLDGIVTTREVQVGQIISSPISNVGGGTTLMTISDLSRLFVLASVDEADIGKITLDQPTIITVDAYPSKKFDGRVVQISPKGVNVSNVVTFEVKIEVTSEDKNLLLPEMTAAIEITISSSDNTLLIPDGAIYRKKGENFVFVVDASGGNTERKIEVG
ncbi:MAG: hypothetical protein C0609_06400, partial [Deltaproteobacteria bacterium]